MILEGHKNAKKRVFLFLSVYIISGSMSEQCTVEPPIRDPLR